MNNKEKLEDVLKFLLPIFNYSIKEIFHKRTNILEEIKKGIKGKNFSVGKINIDFKKLEKGKGKEWVTLLKKQLEIFYDTLKK